MPPENVDEPRLLVPLALALKNQPVNAGLEAMLELRKRVEPEVEHALAISISDGSREEVS